MILCKRRFFIFCFLSIIFLSFASLLAKPVNIDTSDVLLISSFETKNCCASYVMLDGVVYLLKQKKDYQKLLAVVRDALAAYIAKDLGIAHRVYIIPAGKKKKFIRAHLEWPATLHTLAPGETVRKQRNIKYSALRLKQQWANAASFDEKGLTEAIINYMTWHWQLPIIVALDLMTGNSDRHCGNLCYNPETDTFCAIDMDDTFNKDLCAVACKKFEQILQNNENVFTNDEKRALFQMRNTLKFLLHIHKPHDLIAKLYEFAHQAGFGKNGALYDEHVQKRLEHYESMIIKTNESAYQLIMLIDRIVKQNAL